MKLFIVVCDVDLGYHIEKIYTEEEKAEYAKDIFNKANTLKYPMQKDKYWVLEWDLEDAN